MEKLWQFTDNFGSFESGIADKIKTLYFPLCNETLMSSISPDLHGDIKTGQNSFLLNPVSRIDLSTSKASRNFWIYIDKNKIWSATGVSKNLEQIRQDKSSLAAGLLWHKVTRENKDIGLKAEILSFVPVSAESVEIMQIKITNISKKKIKYIPTAAIPIYARSANNIRDHRHVSSLLQRIQLHKFGIISKPTLVFDEAGHRPNKDIYFVLGWDQNFNPPQYLYPTQEIFCGEDGDLEAPASILNNRLPDKSLIQGKEAMGALRFRARDLTAGSSCEYIVLMGITEDLKEINKIINKFNSLEKIQVAFGKTKDSWIKKSEDIKISSGDSGLDSWFRWVSIQPLLRRIFGCSFLPDFDYGKGGRGWRDLWQDCLGLILNDPKKVRSLLINNFSGVRVDGSNATIIGRKPGEFIADRNNISRVWMDHGVWPLLALDLYINETADLGILFEKTAYFRSPQISRSRRFDENWNPGYGYKLKTKSGRIYQGTILEHLLVQNLVQFFNVGAHNYVRLEGADWNDGLDMASEFGESVAFSCMYAHNLSVIARLLEKIGRREIKIFTELNLILNPVNYQDIKTKQKVLARYFEKTKSCILGKTITLDSMLVADNLMTKAEWMTEHIRKREWLKQGFFNGYYNNNKERVEGIKNKIARIMLQSQVFPIMSGVAKDWQIKRILKSVDKYLFDKKLKGYHLNTDFKEEQYNLGRAFSFIYGDKENGAFFNHMIVMYAYALYKRGFAKEGWQVLRSIYNMALDTPKSKIYPSLPEYFNLEGRGMYSYLTGSASWFVLTFLAQVFGVRGKDGDLLIEPKLSPEQFKNTSTIGIARTFAGRTLQIIFSSSKKLNLSRYKIIKARLNGKNLELKDNQSILISRKTILHLSTQKVSTIDVILGE
jgi:cellobiose phosphorylase